MADKSFCYGRFITYKSDEPPKTKNNVFLDFNSALFERVQERAAEEIDRREKENSHTQRVRAR